MGPVAAGASRDQAVRWLRCVQGRRHGSDRPQFPAVPEARRRARNPARGDRLGRGQEGRHPGADQPEAHRGRGRHLPGRRRAGVRDRDRGRCARLPAAHPGLARDAQRRGRRRAGDAGVLHAVWLRDPLRCPRARSRRTVRVRLLGLHLSLQQADVRPGDAQPVAPVHRAPGRGPAHRLRHRARGPAGHDRDLAGVAGAASGHQGALARYRLSSGTTRRGSRTATILRATS